MGFMDKAKKLAEQAQEKLDETQKNFNQKQGGSGSQPAEGGVQYDEHGRPIQQETPAAPSAPAPTEGATGGPAPTPEEEPAPPPPPQQSQGGSGTNASPDPFKPIDQ